MLVSRSVDALEEVRLAIEAANGSAEVRACDIGDGEALSATIEAVASTHGHPRRSLTVAGHAVSLDTS